MRVIILVVIVLGVGVLLGTLVQRQKETAKEVEQDDAAVAESTTNSGDSQETATEVMESEQDTPTPAKGRMVDLSGRGLTQVSRDVFSQTSTEGLDLSNNNLTGSLPAEVRHLQNLVVLDLSDNQFTGVPAEVGQLSKLQVLDLSNNQLTGLPHELGNLQNLRQLDLRGNDPSTFDLDIIRATLPEDVAISL